MADSKNRKPGAGPMKKTGAVVAVAVLTAALGGCFTDTSCVKNKSYVNAKTYPDLKSTLGLTAPAPDPDMQIPNVASGPVTKYNVAPPGTDPKNPLSRCLTTPPPLGH